MCRELVLMILGKMGPLAGIVIDVSTIFAIDVSVVFAMDASAAFAGRAR
jgi:hypothetical protein